MTRPFLAALASFGALCVTPAPSHAQNAQEQLQSKYDRALAAGYKALFLCSAIANAERNGATRTSESVVQWELSGIQEPLDEIVGELPYEIVRRASGQLGYVAVQFDTELPPRIALAKKASEGCSIQPLGFSLGKDEEPAAIPPPPIIVPVGEARERYDPFIGNGSNPNTIDVSAAFDKNDGPARTTAVVVLKDGALAAERYAEPFGFATPQRTWSVAKSLAATLIGVAVQRGKADVNDSVELGVNEDDPRRAITIDQALRMASGRYSDTWGNRTDALYYGGASIEESMTHWPLIREPGTVFRYANNDTLAATQAVKAIDSRHILRTPLMLLLGKIGMFSTVPETDWQGDYVLSSQVWSTARDLAKLGQLYLNDGMWDGERILPEGWTEYVSTPSGPQPDGPLGYGAGFWLFNKSEGIPPDTFAAMGNRGQYVVVVPSRDVVIVRRGEDPVGARFDIVSFTRDVLAALEN